MKQDSRQAHAIPRAHRGVRRLAGLIVVALVAFGCSSPGDPDDPAPRADEPAAAPAPFVETIPGTTIAIEMAPVVLDGGAVWVGRTEVTWDAYDSFVFRLDLPEQQREGAADADSHPSRPYVLADYGYGHAGYPVICVSHAGALSFCAWLSEKTGRRYRLPTEAEFDAICRAACAGDCDGPGREALLHRAWAKETAGGTTQPVGALPPDALGLHDLLGNVSEWCTTADGAPVSKGGSFRDPVTELGCAARKLPTPAWNDRDPQLPKSPWWLSDAPFAGFRVLCEDGPR